MMSLPLLLAARNSTSRSTSHADGLSDSVSGRERSRDSTSWSHPPGARPGGPRIIVPICRLDCAHDDPKRETIEFDLDALARALFTTGRAPRDQRAFGDSSAWELLHRGAVAKAYLECKPGGHLIQSPLAHTLDRSEKAVVSYALGQAISAIYADQALGVQELLHVDRYGGCFGAKFRHGRERADLFGRGPTGWIVIEAKGRWSGIRPALIDRVRRQASTVISIAGETPAHEVGAIVHFPSDRMWLRIVDASAPENELPGSARVSGGQLPPALADRWIRAYYGRFLAVLGIDGGLWSRTDYAEGVVTLDLPPPYGLRVGLVSEIVDALRSVDDRASDGYLAAAVSEILEATKAGPREVGTIFGDGSLFSAHWPDFEHA